jgi:hypothetical protein
MKLIEGLTEEQNLHLIDAFKAVVSLNTADTENNYSSCASFHIKPFHNNWDEQTVKEVIKHVRIYVSTWILYPLSKVVGISPNDVEEENLIHWHRLEANRLEYQLKQRKAKEKNS